MKKTLLTILFLIFSIIIFAKPVNEEKAKEVIVPTMEKILEKHKKEANLIPILVSADNGLTWGDL